MTNFLSDSIPACARYDAWEAALDNFAITPVFDGRTHDGDADPFRGCMRGYRTPRGIDFAMIESGPQVLTETPGRTGDVFWLSMVLSGGADIEIGGRSTTLAAGDIIYGRRGAPGKMTIHTPFRILSANIPAHAIAQSVLVPLPDRMLHLHRHSSTNQVLRSLLYGVADSIENLKNECAFAIEDALVQLMVGNIFESTREPILGGALSQRAALLRRIWRVIEERLGDPTLSIADIAAHERLSVRYVQLLFEEAGESFRTYLRRRRLSRCRADLANPVNANISITSICYHRGFSDCASFSRAFREEFDVSPREFRNATIAATATATATAITHGEVPARRRLAGLTYMLS